MSNVYLWVLLTNVYLWVLMTKVDLLVLMTKVDLLVFALLSIHKETYPVAQLPRSPSWHYCMARLAVRKSCAQITHTMRVDCIALNIIDFAKHIFIRRPTNAIVIFCIGTFLSFRDFLGAPNVEYGWHAQFILNISAYVYTRNTCVFTNELHVLENYITRLCKTGRVLWRHDFPCITFVRKCIYFV